MGKMLTGKVAIVTGGCSGIGLATLERMIEEGAQVAFCDLAPEDGPVLKRELGEAGTLHYGNRKTGGDNDGRVIEKRLGSTALFIPCDVTKPQAVQQVLDQTVEHFGGIDILVNNAGVGGGENSIVDTPEAMWHRMLAVNLTAVWRLIKLTAPLMAKRGGGSIINIASALAVRAMPGTAAYSATKAGLVQLARVAAMELAASFIRVNSVLPGFTLTPILYGLRGDVTREEMERQIKQSQPIPRAGMPVDIANAIIFLASDASSFMTGQALSVDGGMAVEAHCGLRAPDHAPARALPRD